MSAPPSSTGSPSGEEVVHVPEELASLVPKYLDRVREDLRRARASLPAGDLSVCEVVGHKMAGTGGSYGFHRLTDLGRKLEAEARAHAPEHIPPILDEIEGHLSRVKIRVDPE